MSILLMFARNYRSMIDFADLILLAVCNKTPVDYPSTVWLIDIKHKILISPVHKASSPYRCHSSYILQWRTASLRVLAIVVIGSEWLVCTVWECWSQWRYEANDGSAWFESVGHRGDMKRMTGLHGLRVLVVVEIRSEWRVCMVSCRQCVLRVLCNFVMF